MYKYIDSFFTKNSLEVDKSVTACLTGHRPSKLPWRYNEFESRCKKFREDLRQIFIGAYDYGIRNFLTGMAEGFDMIGAEVLLSLRDDDGLDIGGGEAGQDGAGSTSDKEQRAQNLQYGEDDRAALVPAPGSPGGFPVLVGGASCFCQVKYLRSRPEGRTVPCWCRVRLPAGARPRPVKAIRIYYSGKAPVCLPCGLHFAPEGPPCKIWLVQPLHFSGVQGTICLERRRAVPVTMSDEYGSNFVSLTDEDGNEIELEHLDTIEYNGAVYMAFFPVDEADEEGQPPEDDDDEAGLIILKVVEIDGEEQLATLEDEEELEAVYQQFMEALFEEEEE